MKNDKRGISGIVTTVLLILVAITAVALIAAFLIPFIKGTLGDSQDCFKILGKLEIVQGANTYYDAGPPRAYSVMVKRGYDRLQLDGFSIALVDDTGNSEVTLIPDTDIPSEGGSRTYNEADLTAPSGTLISVEVAPIIGDQTCDAISAQFQ
jgi:flagellin-like protein